MEPIKCINKNTCEQNCVGHTYYIPNGCSPHGLMRMAKENKPLPSTAEQPGEGTWPSGGIAGSGSRGRGK